ncbi:MAG: M20/M25/M40 family metallo-hydrolase [Microbacteriaceae bacterium]|nr:M20/M25/M40 family metallo-hydrolase [Microbacteriaceae bacterium]
MGDATDGTDLPVLGPTAATARDLIRFDTTNWGEGRSRGETEAAEYLGERLRALGLAPQYFESAPRRTSVVVRVPGRRTDLPALVVHGHTDVVPADPAAWSVDPFGGEVRDGMLWGRGAVDMKDMDAMIVTAIGDILESGRLPERELVVAFFADEENGGQYGSHWLVEHHPELFAGATEAISEVGGYSIDVAGRRAYLLQTGEKALVWVRIVAHGPAAHGSRLVRENALTRLAEAVAAIGRHEWPVELTRTTEALLAELERLLDANPSTRSARSGDQLDSPSAGTGDHEPGSLSEAQPSRTGSLSEAQPSRTGPLSEAQPSRRADALVARTGTAAGFLLPSLRNTSNPTVLTAGYKHNVIPDRAEALIDLRPLPGQEQRVLDAIRALLPEGVELEVVRSDVGLEFPFEGRTVEAIKAVIERHDPGAPVLPYLMPAGTDNKALSTLGITGYGFAPLRLPAELDFPGLFHGVDERVPLDALDFGTAVLTDFLLGVSPESASANP